MSDDLVMTIEDEDIVHVLIEIKYQSTESSDEEENQKSTVLFIHLSKE